MEKRKRGWYRGKVAAKNGRQKKKNNVEVKQGRARKGKEMERGKEGWKEDKREGGAKRS